MHAYVINLARSPDRRSYITAELAKSRIDYEIITGVDGRDLDLHEPQTVEPSVLARSWFGAGVAGCALSHLRVYQKVLADGLDFALVLEDDVTLPADLGDLTEALRKHLVGAEVVLLTYDSEGTCEMSLEGSVHLPSSRLLVLPVDVGQPMSTAAYIITREACRRMSESVLPVRAKADDWAFFFKEGMLDRVRCVTPLPVLKNPAFESTMDYYPPKSLKARILRATRRYKLPLVRQAIAYRRRRIWCQMTQVELVDKPFLEKPSRLE